MSGFAVQVDGAQAYIGTGSGAAAADAPAVVFIHGAGMDHTVWALPARHFARKGLCVVAPDLPGHGRSSAPANGAPALASVEEMASWVGSLLDALSIATAAVVGHSMG